MSRSSILPLLRPNPVAFIRAVLVGATALLLGACSFVPQRDREFLSDRIMQRQDDALESALESHDFPRREGSVGGSSGSGGGCGC